MRFDVTDLRLFVCVAEAGSITHGAAMANMALGAASARIRGMEEVAGVALLHRERLGVAITPAGRALLQHSRIVLQQLGRMHSELDEFAHGLKGHLRLFSNTNALAEFLPAALSSFLMDNPGVNIDIQEHMSADIVRSVAEGIADIGIVAGSVDVAALETFPFREDTLVVVVPRDHPLAGRRRLAFAETLDYDFIGLSDGAALQDFLAAHAARLGRRLRLRVQLRSFDGICRMVESRAGIAVVPASAAKRLRRIMAIRIIPLEDAWALRRLSICVRCLAELPTHAGRLVAHLRET
ncbi:MULTISPECIES: LysR substrate-binding domain-containing protein [Methylobacterium]|uniref:LysR substrate-binding domain-containing protein n=1 Tax=Methylobacterium TaxID=407 RepID=UPI0013ED5CE4|nr:LysR substrate-binding domain-containing protein [Methylobacterium sp. DB0501]NGM37457.1 LysR family transcriptional regulator [Methylobacterium sp. DB0501]